MEATVYSMSVLAGLVTVIAAAIAVRRSHEGRAFELVLVDADRPSSAAALPPR